MLGIAGTTNKAGYIIITINKKLYRAHRLAFLYMTGKWPKEIDHINHKRSDNRWANLRETLENENYKNKSLMSNNSSGVHGVSWNKKDKVWTAMIGVCKKVIYLGSSKDKFEAICCRMSANNKYGFHRNHGV